MDLEHLRSQFLKLYASVPEKLRSEIIAVVDSKTYSWDSAFIEINNRTALGNEIISKLSEIGLFNVKR
ncbi:MAG: hypothetical protein WC408_04230 [Candidatus Micrarchaeia archaeon]